MAAWAFFNFFSSLAVKGAGFKLIVAFLSSPVNLNGILFK